MRTPPTVINMKISYEKLRTSYFQFIMSKLEMMYAEISFQITGSSLFDGDPFKQ